MKNSITHALSSADIYFCTVYLKLKIERFNQDFKRVLKMNSAMPNYDSVIILFGNVAMNKDVFKYPMS